MSAFEKQLASIKNKAELREWLDGLPDDAQGVLLIQTADGTIKWYEYGDIDVKTTNWIIDHTKAFIVNVRDRA